MSPFDSVAIFIVGPCDVADGDVDRITGGVTDVTTYPRYHPSACSNTYTSSPRSRLNCWAAISVPLPRLKVELAGSLFDVGFPFAPSLGMNCRSESGRKG